MPQGLRYEPDSTTKIISFPNRLQSETKDIDHLADVFSQKIQNSLKDNFKEVMEAWIYMNYMTKNGVRDLSNDNPFDAIYLADLKPDPLRKSTTETILFFSDIVDKSDTIEFEDGWDD